MNLAEKMLNQLPRTQNAETNVFEEPYIKNAMREIAWEAWKACDDQFYLKDNEVSKEESLWSRECFDEWYDKQVTDG